MVALRESGEKTNDCLVGGSVIALDCNPSSGPEVGTTQDRKGENEPEWEPRSGTSGNTSVNRIDLDAFVDLEGSIERFLDRSRDIIRSGQSRRRYEQVIRRFDRKYGVADYSWQQLTGKTGKRLILAFFVMKHERARLVTYRLCVHGIGSVWTCHSPWTTEWTSGEDWRNQIAE